MSNISDVNAISEALNRAAIERRNNTEKRRSIVELARKEIPFHEETQDMISTIRELDLLEECLCNPGNFDESEQKKLLENLIRIRRRLNDFVKR